MIIDHILNKNIPNTNEIVIKLCAARTGLTTAATVKSIYYSPTLAKLILAKNWQFLPDQNCPGIQR